MVSEDGKIEIPIDSNGQFTVDNINITSKTNFIFKYNNGKNGDYRGDKVYN